MSTSEKNAGTETEKWKSLLVIVTGFLILYFIFTSKPLLLIAVGVGLISLLSKAAGSGILWVWDKIAVVLGWINTRILLGIAFYLFVFPVSLLSRLRKKNPMQLKNTGPTLFTTRNHTYTKEDLENTW